MTQEELSALLCSAQLDPDQVRRLVRDALAEDLRYGPDITSRALIPTDAVLTAAMTSRQPGIICGVPIACAVLEAVEADFVIAIRHADGSSVQSGDVVLTIQGPTRQLLLAERTMLNFVGHLSGISTTTRAWVDIAAATGTQIRDTRKTIPGLRALQKYAVRCGSGYNHRLGLGDAILIKDNHIAAVGSITAAISAARTVQQDRPVEVECDTITQVEEAAIAGADLILLDNMDLDEIRSCVKLVRTRWGQVKVEASGGVTLDAARAIAQTGVNFIAVGSLTHSARVLDIGLDVSSLEDT